MIIGRAGWIGAWASLIVAPFVEEVVGVEGSHRRVEVCTQNAKHLGVSNVRFIYVQPGMPLPFQDGSFDGVIAASSVEQTPDPKAVLREFFPVLRPGGRVRIDYEALGRYRNGQEREAWLWEFGGRACRLMLCDRDIDRERVRQCSLTFGMSGREVVARFRGDGEGGRPLSFDIITTPLLEEVRWAITDARFCSLSHPSGRTLVSWLRDIGFREVIPSHSGAWFAGQLFDQLGESRRPRDIEGVDDALRPLVRPVIQMAAPTDLDPMITAVK